MRNSTDIQAHSISLIKDNRVVSIEDYITEIAGDGGGGGDGYTQAEVDALLNNKLNVNNPQDVFGNLRLDPTNGNSKIILNAVSPPNANDDFYCNGSAHINGTLRVSLLTSDGDLNADGVNADTFNSNVITNDIVFNHNDVEYMRFNATDDEIQLSKNIELNEDLIMKSTKVLYLDATTNLLRYITTRNDNGQDILELVNNKATNNQIRFTNNGSTSLIVDNSFVFSSRQIQGNNGLKVDFIDTRNTTADFEFRRNGTQFFRLDTTDDNITCSKEIVAGGGIKCNTYDSDGDSNIIFKRFDTNYMTFQSNRIDIDQPLHLANSLTIDLADKLTLKPSLESSINIFDIRNLHPVADNPMIRFRVGVGGGETIVCEMTNANIHLSRRLKIGLAYGLDTNVINSNGDNDVVFSRNSVQFMALDKFTEDTVEKEAIICSKQLRANAQLRVNNLQINQFSSGVQYADFRLEDVDSIMRFYVGNSTSANLQMTNAGIDLRRETTISSVKTNAIDTNGDNDLTIRRNGTDVLNIFTYTPTNGPTIIVDAQSDCGISSSWLFANTFANRSANTDTYFRGAISGGLTSGKVYMTYLHASETLDFDCDIDNTLKLVKGNIDDTTPSDERLKTNIKDVESNFTECVKNVKIKTFEYTNEKYKDNDKYGFIAQDLLKNLPTEFKNIVRENKEKDSDDKYLSINYMKLSLLLWGCCQEQQSKIEHLEARLFEVEDIIKELKGKGKGETKPKAKSKSKAKNVD